MKRTELDNLPGGVLAVYKGEGMTRDLHNSERAEGNVMTEYEKNFSEKGFTINSAIVRF